jgi:Tol biopolymer transport system component
MPLTAGTRLGPYEVQAAIGAGGMGEVYRARDTRLDRTVALKILPEQFANDAVFRERFDREARLISSLSHPHICPLFDVGQQDGISYLVIEHLEGETLAARLEKGRLKIEQALQIAVQIAGALDTAHRSGVVHRDVKPGNVMLTRSGAKLLDFGLARTGPVLSTTPGLSVMPTTPAAVTAQGTILGTLQYMAPEQLDGSDADARSDIFAFGALVYEMVTGRKAFEGKSQASLIASIMSADPPPMATLQPVAPAALDRVIRKCLAKDPEDRWQSAKDLADELGWIARSISGTVPAADEGPSGLRAPRRGRERLAWSIAAVLAVTTVGTLVLALKGYLAPRPDSLPTYRASLELSAGLATDTLGPGRRIAVSPNGEFITFTGVAPDRRRLLWLRRTDSMAVQHLAGTENANSPLWSPDSKFIAFVAQGRLKKIDVSGGPPITVVADAVAVGASWNRDDVILFSTATGLSRVSASGGTPVVVTTAAKGTVHSDPSFLSDGRHFLYQVTEIVRGLEVGGIYVGSLDANDPPKRLLSTNSNAIASSGYLLFVRDRALMAQSFDERTLTLSGTPTALGSDLEFATAIAASSSFSASETGVLAYRTGAAAVTTELTWFDRKGTRLGTVGERGDRMAVSLSHDGARVAVSELDVSRNARDIWVLDTQRNLQSRFTFDAVDEMNPVWSADGRDVFFAARKQGRLDIFKKTASGAGAETEVLSDNQNNLYPTSVSRDGKSLLYFTGNAQLSTGNDLWVLPLEADGKPRLLLRTEFNELYGVFSPDGRWVAYTSNESGRNEIYVIPFSGSGGKYQVSREGGTFARWRGDSAELYFLAPDRRLMAASVNGRGPAFLVGTPTPLFDPHIRAIGFGGSNAQNYEVSADGQRFLVATTDQAPVEAPITFLVNWVSALRR